jgi:phosphopantothenoylcysteine decarboxylase
MARVLLGVTGSVAAIKTPFLLHDLRAAGHEVRLVATRAALYFIDAAALAPDGRGGRDPAVLTLDEDEWPGAAEGRRYQAGDPVLHIELRRWAELLLLAPLDANTLGKMALGLCDNCLTCLWRAWEPARPAVLAPAMNTLMWQHPATARHLRQLAADAGAAPPLDLPADEFPAWLQRHCPRLWLVPPVVKRLACDDVGVGAMAGLEDIVTAVAQALQTP